MVRKSLSKFKMNKSPKRRSKFSLFPSPQMVRPSKRVKHVRRKRKYNRKNPNMCKVYIRRKRFTELPRRRDLRIQRSIEQSIRSHIDRLAGYRYNSMMKTSEAHCPVAGCFTSSCIMPTIVESNVCCPQKQPIPGVPIRRSLTSKTQKKQKKMKKKTEVRAINLGSDDPETLNVGIQKITESVKDFEKQRLVFLSSLAKIQADVSNLNLIPSTSPKQPVEDGTKPVESNKAKENVIKPPVKKCKPTSMKNSDTGIEIRSRHKKTIANVKSPKLGNFQGNILDNLSSLLMSAPKRPMTKVETNHLDISKLATMQSAFPMKGIPLQGGLMNLAQTFCSMATSFQ